MRLSLFLLIGGGILIYSNNFVNNLFTNDVPNASYYDTLITLQPEQKYIQDNQRGVKSL